MTTRLPFIDRAMVLYRRHLRTRNYELKMLPSLMRRGTQPSSGLLAIALSAPVAAPRLSTGSDRLRWGSHGGCLDIEHTRSNLG